MLTTDQKGAIAEAKIAAAALGKGYGVYRPMFEGGRSDLIFEKPEGLLLRVQCKWAPLHGSVVTVRCYSARRNSEGLLRRPYEAGDFDALGAYCPQLERCYLLPWAAINGATQVQLRIAPTKNNQRLGIRLASQYEFGATLPQIALGP